MVLLRESTTVMVNEKYGEDRVQKGLVAFSSQKDMFLFLTHHELRVIDCLIAHCGLLS
jgi:hypothetical protein